MQEHNNVLISNAFIKAEEEEEKKFYFA